MRIPMFQVDAFADGLFTGNPAAICPLESWISDATMQSIAMENNLAETAFLVAEGDGYHLRWFTPATEVDLCGHATLASAYVVMNCLGMERNSVSFQTQSGRLTVTREGDLYALDFPSRPPQRCQVHPRLIEALGTVPLEVLAARDYLVVYQDGLQVGIAIVFPRLVMPIGLAEGRQSLQPLVDVLDKPWLVVIHIHSGGDVHGGNQHHALAHTAARHDFLYLRGDVHVLPVLLGVEGQVFGMEFHLTNDLNSQGVKRRTSIA